MNPTTPAPDATATPAGMLGISTPRIPRDVARYVEAEAALKLLEARVGEPMTLEHREYAIATRRWWLGFPDGSPVAECSDPLEAVQAGEELLMPSSIPPPITFQDEPPYAVYCDHKTHRVYDFEVAVRIAREKRGFAIRNEQYATDALNEFGGLTPCQVDKLMELGWPWTGVSQVGSW